MKRSNRILFQGTGTFWYLVVAILLGSISGGLIVTQAYYLSYIINRIFLAAASLEQVWRLILILLVIILARMLLAWGNVVVTNRIAGRIKHALRGRILRHLFALGPAYMQGERSGELISTTIEGVEALEPYAGQYLPQVFLSVIVPALILIVIFYIDVPSGIILLVLAPILPLMMVLAGMMTGVETRRRWRSLRLMSAHFLDVLQGLTTIKLFGRSETEEQKIHEVSERFRRNTMDTLRIAFFSSFTLEEAATLSTAVMAVEIGLRLLVGNIAFQPALFILLIAPEYFQPLRQLGAKYHAGASGKEALKRIQEILAAPLQEQRRLDQPSMDDNNDHSPRSAGMIEEVAALDAINLLPTATPQGMEGHNHLPLPEGISFSHVDYTYDGQRPALHDVSFTIRAGQKVALVGPSGAGKSTIAHLLLRFISPASGTISSDGVPIEEIPGAGWRNRVGWIPQHPYLFHASVVENIRLGCPEASMEAVVKAAKLAHAHEFIESLPQQYETMIGERGSRLSGGEVQRISLARAFLKNAPLLVLDEATSYLDPMDEAQVLEAIKRLMQGRTVLILAHRLNTVYDADQIIVLEKGHVVEVGTHSALLKRPGLYSQLISAQKGRKI
jgi:ATP-binding cassette subfamily C protein CydD